MTHTRACPVCDKIVHWTRGKTRKHTLRSGVIVESYDALLICPEHGEFEPRAHEQLNKQLIRVMEKVAE